MAKFPEPKRVPDEVSSARSERYQNLVRSAKTGIAVRVTIAITELIVAGLFGSAALFMDAISTAVDIGTSLVLIISFKLASRPPDANHPFGHGRYEPLAGLQLGLFLVFLGIGMFFYNTTEINYSETYSRLPAWLWVIPLCSTLLLEGCYRYLMYTAKKQHSPALAADAVHYRIDSLTSIFATFALLLGAYVPTYSHSLDHSGAAFIALFMIIVGFNAARNNMHQLLDRIPAKDYFERVRKAALKADGVLGTEKIGMQLYGPDAHVDIDIEVDPKLSVEVAHEISQNVRFEIQKELPEVRDVIVHIEPFYPNDH